MSERETPSDSSPEFDLWGYVRTLWAYKWLIVLCTLVTGAGATFWTLRQPEIFQATTTIEYDPNPVRPLGRDVQDVADPIGHFWSAREFFATQNRIIASRSVAERVVQRLGLHQDPSYFGVPAAGFEPREIEVVARQVLQNLTVEPVKETRLVKLVVRDRSPERAKAIADAFADAYIEKTMEDRMGSTISALEWLGNQLDTLRRELDESELALHQFKEDHNVLSVSMEDRQNLVASEIQSFSQALTEARQRRIEVAARVQRLRASLGEDPLAVSGTVFDERSSLQTLRESLRAKLAERDELGARYGANHPQMRALEAEIAALQEQLDHEVQTIVQNAEADLREIRSVENGVRAALDEAHEAGLELNLREIEYQRLNRTRENKAKLYELVLQRTTETDLTRMLRTTHVRIVDRAVAPVSPVSPNTTVNITAGVAGGLLLGVLLAFGLRFLDRRLRSPEAVEEVGLTVLGVIPHIGDKSTQEITYATPRRRKRRATAQSTPDLFVHDFPMSTAAECCRTVRTNLMFMSIGDHRSKVFVITSTNPREGKTTVASNLAASIAQSGKSVLLIDTDLRRPRVHSSFGVSREVGVSTVIVGEATLEEATQPSRVPGLHVLTSGPVPPNPSELLHSPRFERLIDEARDRYDCVIFDSPPLGAVTDAAIIAPQVDGALIVVQVGETTRDSLRGTHRQLLDVGARILGAVVNDIDFESSRYGKGYYYRRYGGYYAEDSREIDEAAE